jgi:hypothetical protein
MALQGVERMASAVVLALWKAFCVVAGSASERAISTGTAGRVYAVFLSGQMVDQLQGTPGVALAQVRFDRIPAISMWK